MRQLFVLLALSTACRAFGQNYIINTFAGTGSVGPGAAGSGNGSGLGPAHGVAVDSNGNVFMVLSGSVLDTQGNRAGVVVQRDAGSGILRVVAGSTTIQGYRPDDDCNPAINAELNQPNGLAVDSAGNLYIADTGNNLIRKVSKGLIYTVAGNASNTNNPVFGGDGGPAVGAQLNNPYGVAVDAQGNLYIADSGNGRIRMVSAGSGLITTVAGGGTQEGDNGPATQAQLVNPYAVVVDSAGDLYIAETQNNRIRKVSASDGKITTIAGNGVNGFTGNNGPATKALLWFPKGVALDSEDDLYIADSLNNRVRRIDGNGTITAFAGNGGLVTNPELNNPTGVAVDSSDAVYIADMGNNLVWKITTDGTISIVGGGELPLGDNGPATGALLLGPCCLAQDRFGNLYVADSGQNRIRKVSNGVIITWAGTGTAGSSITEGLATSTQLNSPGSVAVDDNGNLYIADTGNSRILLVDVNGVITTVAEDVNVAGLAVDSSGAVYFSDPVAKVIRRVDPGNDNPVVVGLGAMPPPPGGCPDPLPDNNIPVQCAMLQGPEGVAVDREDKLYFYDSWQIWVVGNSIISAVAGNGTLGSGGDGGPATSAELHDVHGMAFDTANNMYIADSSNNLIRKVSILDGTITTIAGNGVNNTSNIVTGDGGPATSAALNDPTGVAVDAVGNVYLTGNDRIRILTLPTVPAPCPAAGCLYSVMPSSLQPTAAGATVAVNVEAGASCSWTTADLPYWIIVSGTASGTGNGAVTLVVLPNNSTASRSATIYIAGQPINVSQAGNSCTYSINPAGQNFSAAGGTGSFAITTGAGCSWSPASTLSWITITSSATGSGNGTITYTVAPNAGAGRTGNINVAGLLFAIGQGAPANLMSGAASQTILIGTETLAGSCGNGTPQQSWNNAGILTIVVQPQLSSLAFSGGTVSGSATYVGAGLACSGQNESVAVGFVVSGTVAPGGATSLVVNFTNTCQATATGTTESLAGTLPANCLNGFDGYPDATGAGSYQVSDPASSRVNSTAFIGSQSASGLCDTAGTQPWNNAGVLTISVQPALRSLLVSGGSFTGEASVIAGTGLDCLAGGQSKVAATVSGTVAPGGATTMTLAFVPVNSPACSATATGTAYELSGSIPASCFSNYDGLAGSSGSGIFRVSDPSSPQPALTALIGASNFTGVCATPQNMAWSMTGIFAISLQPSLNSLVTSGGAFSGTETVVLSGSDCGSNETAIGAGAGVSGIVQAGGAAVFTVDIGTSQCPVNAAGTVDGFNATVPPSCLGGLHLPGSIESGTFELSNVSRVPVEPPRRFR